MLSTRDCITALLATLAATTVSATTFPVDTEINVVFPLNLTYAPPSRALPIVLGLTRSQFAPLLIDEITYTLHSAANSSLVLAEGRYKPSKGDFPAVDSNDTVLPEDQVYFYTFSNAVIGLEGQFYLDVVVHFTACTHGTDDYAKILGPAAMGLQLPYYFTTSSTSARAPVLDSVSSDPRSSGSNSTCLSAGDGKSDNAFPQHIVVDQYRDNPDKTGDACAVLDPSPSIASRTCAVLLDDPTITSIAAAVQNSASAAASASSVAASKSAAAAATANAGVSMHRTSWGFEGLAALWVVFVFSLSGWLFAAW